MKLAKNKDIKNTINRLSDNQLDDYLDNYGSTDIILNIDEAIGTRTDQLDYNLEPAQYDVDKNGGYFQRLITELKDEIKTMKDWKRKGVKYVYFDDDLYVETDGKPCLVYDYNLSDVNDWITEYLHGTL